MSTRASGLADPADGLTASSAISVQRQQETVSAAVSQALATQGGSQSNTNLAPGGSTPQTASTLGSLALRQPLEGATPPPAIASSQEGSPNGGNNGTAVPAAATTTPTPTPTAPSTVPCEPSSSPLYCVYEVQPGDNLGIIAAKFDIKGNEDVTSWQLLVQSNRPDIVSEDDLLQIGQKLRIPLAGQIVGNSGSTSGGGSTGSAVVHTVLSSQTLTEIAERYGVTAEDIMAVAANGIGDPNALAIGKELIIPNPKRFATPAPPAPTTTAAGSTGSSSGGSRGTTSGPRSSAGFMWPTTGPVSSYFGPAHPLGIDIDLFSNPNAPIAAAAAGVVTFAGGNACCSYGYYVVIDHGNGLQTLYAHFSKISVSVGERVSQGEIIGNGGRSGYATGNHLHFEVHSGGAIVNPLDYLP